MKKKHFFTKEISGKEYMIRCNKTGMYSPGGNDAYASWLAGEWRQRGKTWSSIGAVKNHLNQLIYTSYDFSNVLGTDVVMFEVPNEWEIVEIETYVKSTEGSSISARETVRPYFIKTFDLAERGKTSADAKTEKFCQYVVKEMFNFFSIPMNRGPNFKWDDFPNICEGLAEMWADSAFKNPTEEQKSLVKKLCIQHAAKLIADKNE